MSSRAAGLGLLITGALSACEPVPLAPDAAIATVAAPLVDELGLARRSTWRYWDQGGDLGTAWRAPGYDDRAWASGGAPLGYGESYLVTTVGFGAAYARAQFTLDDAARIRGMFGELMHDDGVVVYLNGQRVGSAVGHDTGKRYEGFDWSDDVALLVDGVNTVAVELRQANETSRDLTFDLSLVLVRGRATDVAALDVSSRRVGRGRHHRSGAARDRGAGGRRRHPAR